MSKTAYEPEMHGPKREQSPDARATPVKLEAPKRPDLLAWIQVIGAFCLNLNTWGLMNSYGVYQTFYTLDLLSTHSDSAISWIGSVQAFLMFLVSFFIGPIVDAGHLRPLLLTGSFLSVLGFFMTSLCTEYYQCFLAQGVCMGIGFGMLYLPAPALVSMHFEKHQALAIGLSSTGSGIGGVIFPLVFQHLQPRLGFGWATRILAFILLATSIVPIIVMRLPKHTTEVTESQNSPIDENTEDKPPNMPMAVVDNLIDFSALRDWPYVLCNCGLLSGFMGLYIVLYYINLFALEQTTLMRNADLASYMLLIANAASIVGRTLPSALADVIGPAYVLSLTALISVVLVFCLLIVKTNAAMILWSIVFGAFSGAFFGLPAAGVVTLSSSNARIGARLGMTLGTVGVGVLIAAPIAGAILRSSGGWSGLIGWCGGLMVLSCVSMATARIVKRGWS